MLQFASPSEAHKAAFPTLAGCEKWEGRGLDACKPDHGGQSPLYRPGVAPVVDVSAKLCPRKAPLPGLCRLLSLLTQHCPGLLEAHLLLSTRHTKCLSLGSAGC